MLSRLTVRQLGWIIAFSVIVMILMPVAPRTGPFSAVYGPVAAVRTLQMVGLIFWLMVLIAHAIAALLSYPSLRQHVPLAASVPLDSGTTCSSATLRC
jgi:hypothetical protein